MGLPGCMCCICIPCSFAQKVKADEVNSGPLSTRIRNGLPCRSIILFNVLITLCEEMEVYISIANACFNGSFTRAGSLRLPLRRL